MKTIYILLSVFLLGNVSPSIASTNDFWRIDNEKAIVWDVYKESRLPHNDDIEMAGQRVAAILRYKVDREKRLQVTRDIIFPQLRRHVRTSEPEWYNYRNYLRYSYEDTYLPLIISDDLILDPVVDSVRIDGKLTFYHKPEKDIQIIRSFFPSTDERMLVEKFTLINMGSQAKTLNIGVRKFSQSEQGMYGIYTINIYSDAASEIILGPGQSYSYGVYYSAVMNDENPLMEDFKATETKRDNFLAEMQQKLVLKTPDPILNTLFYFSKIRASENIFDSKMGLIHSPGGGNYYAGIWANDQIEYSGPFFPYLGYQTGNTAALNAYRKFMANIPQDGSFIKSSFEMQGDLPCCSKDRGDAAMIAFGTSQFILALGNREIAAELWPLIEWSIKYNHSKLNEHGVVMSDTDEMEGRIATGNANLSTSSLYYGGLKNAARVAAMLGKSRSLINDLNRKARDLEIAIEKYFGASIEGLETYRYYDGHESFRHWISLPLVMGIHTRKQGTLDALFDKLWTDNGLLVDPGGDVLWDRATLYAFRGAFLAGAANRALEKLLPFSNTRLLGSRVPYVVEAYPEYGMRHLSAESALYCRVFTEGLLGLEPIGEKTFIIKPNIPDAWDLFELNHVMILGADLRFNIVRTGNELQIEVYNNDKLLKRQTIKNGHSYTFRLS